MATTAADDARSPTAPAAAFASVSGFIVDDSGVCIPGAVVRIIRGQGLDRTASQLGPCDAWSYGGGFTFNDLTPGVELTLRATAPGFVTQEKKVVPTLGPTSFLVMVAIRE